LASTNTDS